MDVTVTTELFSVTGQIVLARYAEDRWALVVRVEGQAHPEVLSTNLAGHGIEQPPGYVHVGTYSQHEGLPEALEAAGYATKVGDGPVSFGPYDAQAWLMKLSDEIVAIFEEEQQE